MSHPAMDYPLNGAVELERGVLEQLADVELTANAYRVLFRLLALHNAADGLVRCTLDELAVKLHLTRQTVGLAVTLLIENDLLRRQGPGRYVLPDKFLTPPDDGDEAVLELHPPRRFTMSRVAPAARLGTRQLRAVPTVSNDSP